MTTTQSFINKLTAAVERNNSLLCVGLDPHPGLAEAGALLSWGQHMINQTADLVCCYKPNFAFYEQHGPAGLEALRQTIAAVPDHIPVLLDAKRGDIGSTAAAYARAAFEVWGADAITLSPYLGRDSIAPFLAYPGKMVFVLCYTSNPQAKEVQEFGGMADHLFEHIARSAQHWGSPQQLGFVVGATQPHALSRVRQLAPNRWMLAPGIGAQGGDLPTALSAGLDTAGSGLIVPVSRAVIQADDPRAAALALRDEINAARQIARVYHPATSTHKNLIEQLHQIGCLQFGDFSLASGRKSPFYIDLRRITAHPPLLRLVARAYAALLRPLTYHHLAAVPYAALTIGTAISLITSESLIYPRKEVKAHGTGKSIEGVFSGGDRAVIIEDLVTSGGSVLQAVEKLAAADLRVTDAVVLIDREQGGREKLAARGIQLHAVLSLSQILQTLHSAGRISAEQVANVQHYVAAAQ